MPEQIAIEVRGLEKTFSVPSHRVDSFKERITNPLAHVGQRRHHVLRGVSFDVREGEFFGIVGRNGSGKSTLLKILASIYRADAGTVRTKGRVAPFIELGVGFNPELTARENAVLNGVLMGLTLREARRRLDAVLDFAELEEFVDLRLKNYSSGMLVRLAFAVMVQADADTMLIDEVLAVGDAAFAQKCMDVFHARKRAGKTVVLVTHDMTSVQALCDRAMLLHDGDVQYVGEPEQAALQYLRENFGGHRVQAVAGTDLEVPVAEFNARVVAATLRDGDGEAVDNVELGEPLTLDVTLVAARELANVSFIINVLDEDGQIVFGFRHELGGPVPAGKHMRITGAIENQLVVGRYFLDCWVRDDPTGAPMAVQGLRLLPFVVFGTTPKHGMVSVRADVAAVVE